MESSTLLINFVFSAKFDLGTCQWDEVPNYAEKITRKLLHTIFPSSDFTALSHNDIISHYVIDHSVLSRVSLEVSF
jgi:hypothetical protein